MSLTTAQFLTIADNMAKTLVDLTSAYITTPAATVTNIQNGQTGATNSLTSRMAAFDLTDQWATGLQQTAQSAANAVVAATQISETKWYPFYESFIQQLVNEVGDIGDFVRSNGLMVHPQFSNLINYVASQDIANGPSVLLPQYSFVPAEQILASIAVTGAAAGTFAAGTALNTALYGPSQLYLKNTNAGASGGTATELTVTYTTSAGLTGQTQTVTLSGALAGGALLAIGTVSDAVAVTNITVTASGVAADNFAVTLEPVRVVTY